MEQQESVGYFDETDPEMAIAREKARNTFKYFWRELSWERRRIVPGLDLACVKLAFAERSSVTGDNVVEHMWITEIDFDGDIVSGSLANQPNWLQTVAEGDRVSVPLGRIADWMYVIAGKVFGGFTVYLIRSRMSVSERVAHDGAWGVEFGERAEIVYAASNRNKRTSVFGRFFSKADSEERPEADLQQDHPMSINAESSVREALAKQPGLAHERDERGWTALHREALAGNRNIIRALLEFGADPTCKTPEGLTALDLAVRLDWSGTIDVLTNFRGEGGLIFDERIC